MTQKKHDKHPPLLRVNSGRLARNEVTMLGTSCGQIRSTTVQLQELMPKLKIGYVDADHGGDDKPSVELAMELIDQIGSHSLNINPSPETFSHHFLLNEADLGVINGNHFDGDNQIVFLNPKKFESLERKSSRLTNVLAFVKTEEVEIPAFLKEHIRDWDSIPSFSMSELDSLADLILKDAAKPAPIKGLILAGGRSTRMGQDKGAMVIHEKNQREHLLDMVTPLVDEAFLSCRQDQLEELAAFNTIPDRMLDMGPMGAIISAFMSDPNAAWLVLACDLAMIDQQTVDRLVKERNPWKVGTSFKSPQSGFPEPLVAIWEPKSYQRLLSFLSLGYSCPRKVLINSDVEVLDIHDPGKLANVNTPEDLDLLKK
jgi:molybdopterin-guanine dinucleotide biosynthesis protein A